MTRDDVMPGDVMLKLNTGGLVGNIIGSSTQSEYVHGGIAGQGTIYDVNGGLATDWINGKRLLPNIYRTSLEETSQLKTAYQVWRCIKTPIVNIVHREAAAFVAVGTQKRWNYNFHVVDRVATRIVGNITALAFGHNKTIGIDEKKLDNERLFIANGGSFVGAAKQTNRSFFCTEWIVWMYLLASYKAAQEGYRQGLELNIRPYEAIPKDLARKLNDSPDFTAIGIIPPG